MPQWMNIPKRASRHQLIRLECSAGVSGGIAAVSVWARAREGGETRIAAAKLKSGRARVVNGCICHLRTDTFSPVPSLPFPTGAAAREAHRRLEPSPVHRRP